MLSIEAVHSCFPFPLPVRYHIYYGEPIHFDYKAEQADDPKIVRSAAQGSRRG